MQQERDRSRADALDQAFRAGLSAKAAINRAAEFISIGQNCNAAWYLKATGYRQRAFPFDWIFSSPQIVAHCITDKFSAYLDRNRIIPIDDVSAGHSLYHRHMFRHRSPIPAEAYRHYQRCVAQFLELFRSDAPVVLVSVMLPEHDKRPGWAGGFTPEFPRPANMSAVQEYSELLNLISMRRAPSSLIVIKQKTEQTNPRIAMRERTGNLIEIEFDACGRNDGVRYLDSVDDTICRVFFAAMTY